jgi:tetrahydromethanopterin S-methyltransferase subunit E
MPKRAVSGQTAMNDAMGAGMLRAWVMLWNMGLTALLAAVALGLGVVAFMHVVASIRDDSR